MKYMRQFFLIMVVTGIGEILKLILPFPIPASVYGLVVMLGLLLSGKLHLSQVKETGEFLIEIMPLMFIPSAVGLLDSWPMLRPMLVPFVAISVVTTFLVMGTAGKVTDLLLAKKGGQKHE